MRNIKYGVIGLAGIALSATAGAQTQEGYDFRPTNIAVRLGVSLPIDSALADYGSPLIGLGVEYTISSSQQGSGATYLSLDYLTSGIQFDRGVYALCINQRFYFDRGKTGPRTYGFVGIGGASVNVRTADTVIAGRAGLGADLGPAIFFETALLLTDHSNGATGDSISMYLGYRF